MVQTLLHTSLSGGRAVEEVDGVCSRETISLGTKLAALSLQTLSVKSWSTAGKVGHQLNGEGTRARLSRTFTAGAPRPPPWSPRKGTRGWLAPPPRPSAPRLKRPSILAIFNSGFIQGNNDSRDENRRRGFPSAIAHPLAKVNANSDWLVHAHMCS